MIHQRHGIKLAHAHYIIYSHSQALYLIEIMNTQHMQKQDYQNEITLLMMQSLEISLQILITLLHTTCLSLSYYGSMSIFRLT